MEENKNTNTNVVVTSKPSAFAKAKDRLSAFGTYLKENRRPLVRGFVAGAVTMFTGLLIYGKLSSTDEPTDQADVQLSGDEYAVEPNEVETEPYDVSVDEPYKID